MKFLVLKIIKIYQKIFSPDKGIFRRTGKACRFYPSCSEYAYQAVERYGVFWGIWLGTKRILRCHPWSEGGIDALEA